MSYFPSPRLFVPELQPILRAWSLTPVLHTWCEGATDADIAEAERILGRHLPDAMKALYQMSDSAELLFGNLMIYPLMPIEDDSLSLVTASSNLRKWEWPIPDELVMFGSNGSDDLFGLWLPEGAAADAAVPVIQVGEIFEPRCMAVVGTSLCTFLKAWSAYYIMLEEEPDVAVDALGVPQELRAPEPDMPALFAWADPGLPDTDPNPYQRGLTADDLRRMYGGAAR